MEYMIRGAKAAAIRFGKRGSLALFNVFSSSTYFRPMEKLREAIFRLIGVKFDSFPSIGDNLFILKGENVSFGRNCTLGHYCRIYDWYPIVFGDKLFCSNQLTIVSASHDVTSYDSFPGPVIIGSNVWIGINVTIVGPVTIGNNVVIGAGSVVLKNIPDNAIAAGVPAKVIRTKT